MSFSASELPPDDEGPFVPGAESSPTERYEHMERAGTIMVLAGLGAGVLGGVLLGVGLGSEGGGSRKYVTAPATGLGAALCGAGGLSILIGIPLAAVGSASLP